MVKDIKQQLNLKKEDMYEFRTCVQSDPRQTVQQPEAITSFSSKHLSSSQFWKTEKGDLHHRFCMLPQNMITRQKCRGGLKQFYLFLRKRWDCYNASKLLHQNMVQPVKVLVPDNSDFRYPQIFKCCKITTAHSITITIIYYHPLPWVLTFWKLGYYCSLE